MLIQERLSTTNFTPSEQVIANYLLEQKLGLETKNTSSIARETFSSKSTIVKVAQKLHYKGWNDFKQAYMAELRYLESLPQVIDANYPFNKTDHFISISKKIAQLKQEAIQETMELLTYKDLEEAVTLLSKAKAIHVFALSNNLLLAQEFRYNMERIKRRVIIHLIQGEAKYAATLIEPDECALFISYSGETELLVWTANQLKKAGVPMLLLTSIGENNLLQLVDVSLRITTRESLYSKISTYSNDSSITYLLDVLYSCIFRLDYEGNLLLRQESSKLFEESRFSEHSHLKK